MDIVTGYRGEAHITSDQDRAGNQGAIGTGSYIMNVGQQLITETISATEIRIRDGALCHQGCIGVIAAGAYDVVEIANGSQGMLRKDLIVCRYTKDAETNVESLELVAIQGEPAASSPSVPSYNSGNIQAGDTPVDMPLYQVNINGISIDSITKVASNVRTQAETDTLVGNTSISGIGNGTLTGAVSTLNSKTTWHGFSSLTAYKNTAANTWESTGNSFTVPNGHVFFVALVTGWSSGQPTGLGLNKGTTLTGNTPAIAYEASVVFQTPLIACDSGTWYVYSKRSTAGSATNNYYMAYIDFEI